MCCGTIPRASSPISPPGALSVRFRCLPPLPLSQWPLPVPAGSSLRGWTCCSTVIMALRSARSTAMPASALPRPTFPTRCSAISPVNLHIIPYSWHCLSSICRNGSISRDLVPLWSGLYLRTVATGPVNGISSSSICRNGSISWDLVPLWNGLYLRTVATGSVNGISSSSICRNGSIS